MTNILTYDDTFSNRRMINFLRRVYFFLDNRKWNKLTPCVETEVEDANYSLTSKKFTEFYWSLDECCYTIKCKFFQIRLVSV